jgi:hypothetical protein
MHTVKKTSSFRGVYYNKQSQRWRAQISYNGKRKDLGTFKTELDAAIAYTKQETIYIENPL